MPLKKLTLAPGINNDVTSLSGKGGWFDGDKIRFRAGFPENLGGWAPLAHLDTTFLGVGRTLINWVTLANENLLGIGTHLKYYIERGGTYHDITPLRSTSTITSGGITTTVGSSVIVINAPSHGATTGDFVTIETPTALLSGVLSDVAVTIAVDSTADFTTSGAIWIDLELIAYTGVTVSTFTGCIRGISGAAASHLAGTIVYVDVGGIPGSAINGNHQVTVIDSDTFSIDVGVAATASLTTGHVVASFEVPAGGAIFTLGTGWGAGVWGGAPNRGWGEGADSGIGIQLRLWNHGNFGEWLILGVRGGALYIWKPDVSTSTFNRATALTAEVGASDVPIVHNSLLISDVSRFVICFGVNPLGSVDIDPMLVRWSDQESVVNWTPSVINQASFQRLSRGSYIVTAKQTRQEILVWTDTALYSMQYVGPPFVWGFTLLRDNISITSPNSVVVNDKSVVWMGKGGFYIYNGQVNTLPCSVWSHVFDHINNSQNDQIVSGINGVFDELWWFYCSSSSTEIDTYVIYNDVENLWYAGTIHRTAWLYSPIRQYPMGVSRGQVYYHETTNDNGETNPPTAIESFLQSSDIDIDDGEEFVFVWRTVPDITFDGSSSNNPQATLSLSARRNPGVVYNQTMGGDIISADNYVTAPAHLVQRFTQYVYTRVRGRQVSLRVGSNSLGTHWRLGTPRIDVQPDGSSV